MTEELLREDEEDVCYSVISEHPGEIYEGVQLLRDRLIEARKDSKRLEYLMNRFQMYNRENIDAAIEEKER